VIEVLAAQTGDGEEDDVVHGSIIKVQKFTLHTIYAV
jgi:hypothetical protein